MSQLPSIQFHFLVSKFHFQKRTELKRFLECIIKKEGCQLGSINFIFCTDAYLLEINQQYLKHNTFTDIITFQYSPENQPILSDIYISIERIKENAVVYAKSFQQELHRVIFHGVLHLCGFKDKKIADKAKMTQKEDFYLNLYFVPREIS